MMTLGDMAAHVCGLVGMSDDESLTACKGFLDRRYRLIWDARLWRETVDVVTPTGLTAGTQEVVLTESPRIERVLQICANDNDQLNPIEWTTLWLTDPTAFATQAGGPPVSFTLRRNSASRATTAQLALGALEILNSDASDPDTSMTVTIVGVMAAAQNGNIETHSFECSAETTNTGKRFSEIWSITRDRAVGGDLVVNVPAPNFAAVAEFQPSELSAFVFPAFRIWRPLPANSTLRILGKLRCPGFFGVSNPTPHTGGLRDDAAALIPGIDEPLLCHAQADMLERQRQYGKAAAKRAEGEAMLLRMVDLQRAQTADGMQIIPWMEPEPTVGTGFSSKSTW